jgi:elongation factor 1-alpha
MILKLEDPPCIKTNEAAHGFICEAFGSCEGMARLAVMEGNSAVMLGKITEVEF